MSLTYTTYQNSLVNLMPVPSAADPGFSMDLPNVIDYAELRCYRDLQLLNTVTRDSSAALSLNTRTFNLPSSVATFVVTQDINVITPAGTVAPDSGTRNPLVPSSKEMLDFMWPSSSGSTVPTYFAMVTQTTIVVGPWPDQAYQVEVVGTVRPTPLSATNASTILSTYFPDLFIAASMVRLAGLMKNYGMAVDDPQQGVTWEQQYTKLLASAQTEEAMKKFQSQGWSPNVPAPLATPPRT
jgi:hypothetical protein